MTLAKRGAAVERSEQLLWQPINKDVSDALENSKENKTFITIYYFIGIHVNN